MIDFLFHLIDTRKRFAAVVAFEKPPQNRPARRWKTAALAMFILAGVLLLVAGITFAVGQPNTLSEIFGWAGAVCLQFCVVCGLRYAVVNRNSDAGFSGRKEHL